MKKYKHQRYANQNNRQTMLCIILSVKCIAVWCNNVQFITNWTLKADSLIIFRTMVINVAIIQTRIYAQIFQAVSFQKCIFLPKDMVLI